MFCFIFISVIIKINHLYLNILDIILEIFKYYYFVLHIFPTLVPYRYDVILSRVCNLLSSLLVSAILLIYSVYTLCASPLNLFFNFSIILFFNKQYLY